MFEYIKIKKAPKGPPFKKVAVATWGRPGDPQIYGTIELDLTEINNWKQNQFKDIKISPMHFVAKAVGLALKKLPELNGLLRFGKLYLRENVDIFFQVMVADKNGQTDLSGVKIENIDKKSIKEIALELEEKVKRVRIFKDTDIQKTSRLLNFFPTQIIKCLLNLTSFIFYTLNIKVPFLIKDQFGGVMISNIGALGLDAAFAPLVPYSRVPFLILLGKAQKRPKVVDDKIVAVETIPLNATIDHRFCDGALLARFTFELHEIFSKPEKYL